MEIIKTVFIDTNILFSAAATPKGWRARFLLQKLVPNFELITSDYVICELENSLRKGIKRHKDFRKAWKNFKKQIEPEITVVKTPKILNEKESRIADIKDRPILRAALASASIFLTEDKDFLRERNQIDEIEILSTEEFEKKYFLEN